MKKHPLTLLEVVIAISLTAMLLSFLFSSFRQISVANIKVQKSAEEVHARACVHLRIAQLLRSLEAKEGLAFYTSPFPLGTGKALIMASPHTLDKNPAYCGKLKSVLYLNNDQELCLLTYSKDEKEARNDILLTHVKEMSFQFFHPSQGKYQPEWEEESPPPIVKILLKQEKELTFSFIVPQTHWKVTYEGPR